MANEKVENDDEMCLFKEVEGDLFSCPYRSSMAHCVSEEFKMGRGIALMFKKRFGQVEDLWNQGKRVGQVAILKDDERYIYYLVIKQCFYDKPSYQSLGWSLVDMRDHCLKHGVKELSMPRIGCGLDLLEWTEVSAMIKEIFTGTGISITIYNWVDKEEKQEVVNKAPNFRHMELKEKGQQMSGMENGPSRPYIPGLSVQDQSGSSSKKKKKRKKIINKGKILVVNGDDGDDDNEQQSDRPPQSCDGQVNRVEASSHPNPDSARHKVERDQADPQTNPIDQVEKPKSAAQQSISKVGEGNLQPSVNPENHNKDSSRQQQIRPSQVKEAKESGMGLLFCAASSVVPKGRGRGSAGGQSGGKGQNKRVGGSGRELLLEIKVEVKVELNLQTKESVVPDDSYY